MLCLRDERRVLASMALLLAGCSGTAELGDRTETATPAGTGGGSAGTGSGAPCSSGALALEPLQAVDADHDGLFEPGERIEVGGYLEGSGTGLVLRVTSDNPRVEPQLSPELSIGSLEPGVPTPVHVPFVVPYEVWGGSEVGFTLQAFSPAEPACTTSPGEHVVTVSTYGDDLDVCPVTRQLELSEPAVVDGDGDGLVEPGEDVMLDVTLANPGPSSQDWYPGVVITSDHAGITASGPTPWLYAIFPETAERLSAGFHVDAGVAAGTRVRFTLAAAALHVRCRNVPTLEYSIIVQ